MGLKKVLLTYIYNIFLYRHLWAITPTFNEYDLYPQYCGYFQKVLVQKNIIGTLSLKTYIKTILNQGICAAI
jgi:hypothetical protein